MQPTMHAWDVEGDEDPLQLSINYNFTFTHPTVKCLKPVKNLSLW